METVRKDMMSRRQAARAALIAEGQRDQALVQLDRRNEQVQQLVGTLLALIIQEEGKYIIKRENFTYVLPDSKLHVAYDDDGNMVLTIQEAEDERMERGGAAQGIQGREGVSGDVIQNPESRDTLQNPQLLSGIGQEEVRGAADPVEKEGGNQLSENPHDGGTVQGDPGEGR
jgi:hypothetical protein